MKKQLISIILLLTASAFSCFAANETKLDAKTQQQVVEKVKEYCALMQELSGDVEKIDKMETIYGMCENSNVSVFNDLTVPSARDISVNSMPLQQYMMMLTDKFENNVKTSYSGYKYVKTIVQPSPLEGFDATSYAFVKVNKQVNTGSYKAKMNLNVIVNTETKKVSSTISEDYEDPQSIYLEALEKFNDKDYKAAIQLFNKVCNLQRFSGRNRAKSMLGWIYAEQKEYQKANDLLRESSTDDPLGAVILASKILMRDDVPVTLRNPIEAGQILGKVGEIRDKDFPTLHLIAKSAIVDGIDIQNMKVKINVSNDELKALSESLISDPYSNDAFKMRGYFLKGWNVVFAKDAMQVDEAYGNILKAEEMLKKANLRQKDFEKWDTQIFLTKIIALQKKGEMSTLQALLKNILTDKPYIAGLYAFSFVTTNQFEKALEYYTKAAEYGDPYANYLLSLTYLPMEEPLPGYQDLLIKYILKKIPGRYDYNSRNTKLREDNRKRRDAYFDFAYFLLTNNSHTRSMEEYLKWLQRAVDLGETDAMEDMAYIKVIGMFPGVPRNIPEGLKLICDASQANHSRYVQDLQIRGLAYGIEQDEKIPYLQSETYKTLKNLADQGNSAAAYFMYVNLDSEKDTVQARKYLEQSINGKNYYALYTEAFELLDRGEIDKAFNKFLELTMFQNSSAYGQLGNIERYYRHNYQQALKYYREGQVEYDYECYEGLSDMYKEGLGCDKNLKAAQSYMELAIGYYKQNFDITEDDPTSTLKNLMDKRDEINKLIASGDNSVTAASNPITQLNQLLDNSISEDERITKSETLLADIFASPKAVVKTVGSNGKTVVSTETAEDFLLRLATMPADKKLVEVSSKKDKNGKYTELTVQMK